MLQPKRTKFRKEQKGRNTGLAHRGSSVSFGTIPGKGFKYILSGMNAERILIAAECIGDAKWLIERSVNYANDREVFGRAIGKNQGVQFPLAKAYANMRAAELMVNEAIRLFEANENPGAEANMAKLLAADASNEAANAAVQLV